MNLYLDWEVASSLDDTWRSPTSIKRKSKLRAEPSCISQALERLAAAGLIERHEQITGGIHRLRGRGGAVAKLGIHLYRRRQVS